MNRAATIAASALLAAASLAGVWCIRTVAKRPSALVADQGPIFRSPPGFDPASSHGPAIPRSNLQLATLPDGRIVILNGASGEEALAFYEVDPAGSLSFRAGRRIRWDLCAFDFSSNGKGLSVVEMQRAIASWELRQRNNPVRDELRAAEARRRAEEQRVRELNEDEARRLREREEK